MPNLPELNPRETLVLRNLLKILISQNLEIISSIKALQSGEALGLPVVFIRPTFNALLEKEILNTVQFNNAPHYELNSEYTDEFYALAESLGLVAPDDTEQSSSSKEIAIEEIPASDRFVTIGDNFAVVDEAKEALEKLSASIKGANDELFADAEQRLQISQEFDHLKEIISRPKIHLSAVWDFVKNNSTLKFLANQTVSFVVRQDASAVTEAFHRLLHFLMAIN
jgi:hypothetical protein